MDAPTQQPAPHLVACYSLALIDMQDVERVARLIAGHDPFLGELRDDFTGARIHDAHALALAASRRGFEKTLNEIPIRQMLETGLVVTYARPFTRGRGTGFPLPRRFVPSHRRDLHDEIIELRNQVYAHVDSSGPPPFRRSATVPDRQQPGVSSVTVQAPAFLDENRLRALADLADEVHDLLWEAITDLQGA